MSSTAVASNQGKADRKPAYVFEAPVRLWHWTNFFAITVLAVTGYFIAHPLPAVHGEASDHFIMGNIRMIHFIAAYVFAVGMVVRVYWALVGNRISRQLFIVPVWRKEWWADFLEELKFYSFLSRHMSRHEGHNALAQGAYWLFNVVLALVMICTGFALYSQGTGDGSWADTWFGWVFTLIPSSQTVRMIHLFGMWTMVMFVIIHIYMVTRADIIGRQSSISTMIGGWRMYRED